METLVIELPGGRKIGPMYQPFIIAEIGSNWTTLGDCLLSISKAKACGADAVKFQLYDHKSLYGLPGTVKGELPLSWISTLKEKADAVGIEFMCSAFSPELYMEVDKYVNIHKVASAEASHLRILETLGVIGKPVILSTGAKGTLDVMNALSVLDEIPVVLMYCVAAYPAQEINLRSIQVMRDRFKTLVGFSDHSTDVGVIPVVAHARGAVVIEKHVTFIDAQTPDSPHSLNEEQFQKMVKLLRDGEPEEFHYSKEETPMILKHNRRLIATRPIQVGERLGEGENFGIYRSLRDDTHAANPFLADDYNGKIALRTILPGEGIGPGDV